MHDARALAGPTIAAIGPGTARALREHGIEADIVPERSIAESLVEALREVPVKSALIARAQDARDVLPDALRERGAEVTVLALYRTVAEPLSPQAREAALGADYATFTSASSARFFHEAAGTLAGPRLVSIGPVTSEALRALGSEPDVEAPVHTPDGLVDALLADAAPALNAGSVGACAFSSSAPGGVGVAAAAIARRRDFFDKLVLADVDHERAAAAVDRLGDPRYAAAALDATNRAGDRRPRARSRTPTSSSTPATRG